MSKEQARRCDTCGKHIVLEAEAWRKIEKAAVHSGCGGRFPEPVARMGEKRRSA